METTKAEGEELVQSKMRREITSLEDDKLWAEFEQEGIDRILSGEIKPKTLITNYGFPSTRFAQRGPLIAKAMRSVIPNSKQIRWVWGLPTSFKELIRIGKERGCTSLVLARTNCFAQDEICIVSLLNGAAAYFRVLNLTPWEVRRVLAFLLPNWSNLPSLKYGIAPPTTRKYAFYEGRIRDKFVVNR